MATKSTPKFNSTISKMAVVKMGKNGATPTKSNLGTPRKMASVKTGATSSKAVVKKGASNGRMPGKNVAMARSTRANVC